MDKQLKTMITLLLLLLLPGVIYAQVGPPMFYETPLNELKTEFRPMFPDPLGYNLYPNIFAMPPVVQPSAPKVKVQPRIAVFDTITMVEKVIGGKKVWVRYYPKGGSGVLAEDARTEKVRISNLTHELMGLLEQKHSGSLITGRLRRRIINVLIRLGRQYPKFVIPQLLEKYVQVSQYPVFPQIYFDIQKIMSILGPIAIRNLTFHILNSKSKKIKKEAIYLLLSAHAGAGASTKTIKALLKALKDKDKGVRSYAVSVIGKLAPHTKKIIKTIKKVAKHDKSKEVRKMAKSALTWIRRYPLQKSKKKGKTKKKKKTPKIKKKKT